jgi:hypothetical protein
VATAEPLERELAAPWCRAARVLWRRTLAGVVLLPPDGAEPVALSGPAAGIWELLARPMTETDLVAALAATYQIREERVAGEVGPALDVLMELGALCRG